MPLILKYRILNEKGEIEREGECHSWTKQFLQLLGARLKSAHTDTIRDTTNNLRTFGLNSGTESGGYYPNYVLAPAGIVTYGIIIGTGTNANSPTDYQIQTIIPHATCSYGVVSMTEAVVGGSTIFITINRTFANGSGGSVTVNELALYVYSYFSNVQYFFCIARDKLDPGVTIANGTSKTVQYVITETN